jgi:glutathione S-transferase
MKLHWSPRSPYVRKVMICAYETGLEGRIERVRSVAAMKRPNRVLMQDNPLSKIPTLVLDDGRALFDSVVICEYLDSLHDGQSLFPKSAAQRWEALRWHALGDGMLDALILWRNERERATEQRSGELLDAFELKIHASLGLLEREAGALQAAQFAIGHIAIGCALGYLEFRFPDVAWRPAHPRIAAWFESFKARPSVQKTTPVDDQ